VSAPLVIISTKPSAEMTAASRLRPRVTSAPGCLGDRRRNRAGNVVRRSRVRRPEAGRAVAQGRDEAKRHRGPGALAKVVGLAEGDGRPELRDDVLLGHASTHANELLRQVVDPDERVRRSRVAVVLEVRVFLGVAPRGDDRASRRCRSKRYVDRRGVNARPPRHELAVRVPDLGRLDDVVDEAVGDDPSARRIGRSEGRLGVDFLVARQALE
jgi:hypothetical protein